jgi:hypothetical protein
LKILKKELNNEINLKKSFYDLEEWLWKKHLLLLKQELITMVI